MENVNFEAEVLKSKKAIEERIEKDVTLFSYPFSFPKYRRVYQDLIKEASQILKKNSFIGACTTIIGTNSVSSDPFCLNRIQIKNNDDLFHFKAKLEGAYNWVGSAQRIYQKMIEPFVEKIG